MHPQVNHFLIYEPTTTAFFQPVYDELTAKGVLYIYSADNINVGMFKLVPQTHRNSHVGYLGGLAVHPSFTGKGYGYHMMQEIIELGKGMGLLRIELSTGTTNEKAIRLYERAGFQKEGILRKITYIKNEDLFLDEIMMSYLY